MILLRIFSAIALLFSGLALFATIWTVIEPPTYYLWIFAVGATEWSLYFGLLGLLGALFGALSLRRSRRRTGIAAIFTGIIAASLSAVPYFEAAPVARRYGLVLSLREYLGLEASDSNSGAIETKLYATVDGQELKTDIYRPAGSGSKPVHPAIIVIHGGSWRYGHRSDFQKWDYFLASEGYVVFDIDYRLAPQPNWKTAVGDIKSAIGWVKANAAQYEVNPSEVGLLGRSAGGHLALLAAYTPNDPKLPASIPAYGSDTSVSAVVSLYGPTDLLWGYDNVANPDVIGGQDTLRHFLGGAPSQIPQIYSEASPIAHVGANSPPTLLFHGGRDLVVGPQHAIRLSQALTKFHVDHRFYIVPYALHGFDFNYDGWGSQIIRKNLVDFLHRNLRLAIVKSHEESDTYPKKSKL